MQNYDGGQCFTIEMNDIVYECVVVSIAEKGDTTYYGFYAMPISGVSRPRIRQLYMFNSPTYKIHVRDNIIRLHWMTFDEVTEMLVSFGGDAKTLAYTEEDKKDSDQTRHLFIEHNGKIIQISLIQTPRVSPDNMIKYLYVKNITREEFERLMADDLMGLIPFEEPCNALCVDKFKLYSFMDSNTPPKGTEMHGAIIGNRFTLVDFNFWRKTSAIQLKRGLFNWTSRGKFYRKRYATS